MATRQLLLLLVISCAFSGILAQKVFQGSVTITNDPAVTGFVTGSLTYSANATTTMLRIDYDIGPKAIMVWTSNSTIRYITCGSSCDTEVYSNPIPVFYNVSGDTKTTQTIQNAAGQTCTRYNKASSTALSVASVFMTNSGVICRAVFGNGMTYDFSSVSTSINATRLTDHTRWNCPVQQCHRAADIVFVLDLSGSIGGSELTLLKNFALNVTKRFSVAPSEVNLGLVTFNSLATIRTTKLATDATTFNNLISSFTSTGGNTCIGCGIREAMSLLDNSTRLGKVPQLMFVLTDGENNECDYYSKRCHAALDTMAAKARVRANTTVYAIGVDGAKTDELEIIASTSSNVFFASSWSKLDSFVNQLVSSTCDSLPSATPCGSGCKGFCGCNGQCLCPSCNDGDSCTVDTCVNGTNGNGCTYNTKTCNDNSLCTSDSCDSNTPNGCVFDPISCESDSCNTASCTATGGCSRVPITCNDNNLCTSDSCDISRGGCVFTNITANCLNPSDKCNVYGCVPSSGCSRTAVDCDDNNACTTDTCNPASGCVHTNVTCPVISRCNYPVCNPSSGCSYVDNSTNCNDNDACTIDSCSAGSGCQHAPVVCPPDTKCGFYTCSKSAGCVFNSNATKCNDNNPCTTDTCNVNTGCVYTNITGCTNCARFNCNNGSLPCEIWECVEAADKTGCRFKSNVACNDGNACTQEACNPATGTCDIVSTTDCPPIDCKNVVCNTVTGKCDYVDWVCNDNNPCTNDTCSNNKCIFTELPCAKLDCASNKCNITTGKCQSEAQKCDDNNKCTRDSCKDDTCIFAPVVCDYQACKEASCNLDTGACDYQERDCDDQNECTRDYCDVATDKCVHEGIVCDDQNACTTDTCDTATGCVYKDIDVETECNDYSVCTKDFCNVTVGCQHEFIPCSNDSNLCTSDTCDPVLGCQYLPFDCSTLPEIAEWLSTCNQAVCDPLGGCSLQLIDGRSKDNCGVCEGDGSTCKPTITPAAAGGIAAGAVAGIVIASVVVAAALGAFGGKKGYDWLQSKNAAVGEVNNNPLFQEANNSFANPLHESEINSV